MSNRTIWIVAALAVLMVVFSFLTPYLFTQFSILDLSDSGEIGDSVGGMMGPFIGIAGVVLTFLAFYMQYEANRTQIQQFRTNLQSDREQNRKDSFENQFFENIKLHRENVKALRIERIADSVLQQGKFTSQVIEGRMVFELMLDELEVYYKVARKLISGPKGFVFHEAYRIFFQGLVASQAKAKSDSQSDKHDFYHILFELKNIHKQNKCQSLPHVAGRVLGQSGRFEVPEVKQPLLNGYSSQLAHYYRHLFHTVKSITNQPESFLSYEEKRKYLRTLRGQLSNEEQVLLFYNWYSGFGKNWQDDTNKFFTDYRMIHNIYQELLMDGIILKYIPDFQTEYRKEKNRESDPLFEINLEGSE